MFGGLRPPSPILAISRGDDPPYPPKRAPPANPGGFPPPHVRRAPLIFPILAISRGDDPPYPPKRAPPANPGGLPARSPHHVRWPSAIFGCRYWKAGFAKLSLEV
jgi:hypothetical protein